MVGQVAQGVKLDRRLLHLRGCDRFRSRVQLQKAGYSVWPRKQICQPQLEMAADLKATELEERLSAAAAMSAEFGTTPARSLI